MQIVSFVSILGSELKVHQKLPMFLLKILHLKVNEIIIRQCLNKYLFYIHIHTKIGIYSMLFLQMIVGIFQEPISNCSRILKIRQNHFTAQGISS